MGFRGRRESSLPDPFHPAVVLLPDFSNLPAENTPGLNPSDVPCVGFRHVCLWAPYCAGGWELTAAME